MYDRVDFSTEKLFVEIDLTLFISYVSRVGLVYYIWVQNKIGFVWFLHYSFNSGTLSGEFSCPL